MYTKIVARAVGHSSANSVYIRENGNVFFSPFQQLVVCYSFQSDSSGFPLVSQFCFHRRHCASLFGPECVEKLFKYFAIFFCAVKKWRKVLNSVLVRDYFLWEFLFWEILFSGQLIVTFSRNLHMHWNEVVVNLLHYKCNFLYLQISRFVLFLEKNGFIRKQIFAIRSASNNFIHHSYLVRKYLVFRMKQHKMSSPASNDNKKLVGTFRSLCFCPACNTFLVVEIIVISFEGIF